VLGSPLCFRIDLQHLLTSEIPFLSLIFENGRDSPVGTATRYGMDGPGIESRWRARITALVQTGPGAYPASYTMGTGSFPGEKRPGRGVDHPFHLAPMLKKE